MLLQQEQLNIIVLLITVYMDNATNDAGLPNSGNTRAVGCNTNLSCLHTHSAGGGGFGGLYKSTDGGYNFTLQSNSPNILSWEVDGSEDGQAPTI